MMKFGGGGGFFAPSSMLLVLLLFFFIGAQISDAVMCPQWVNKDTKKDIRNCSACASWSCGMGKLQAISGDGCTEDFFRDCAGYYQATDFLKLFNPLKACYYDGTTAYISGCEKEVLGGACMNNNMLECRKLYVDAEKDGYGTPEWPFYSGSNGIGEGIWKLSGMILLGWTFARFY